MFSSTRKAIENLKNAATTRVSNATKAILATSALTAYIPRVMADVICFETPEGSNGQGGTFGFDNMVECANATLLNSLNGLLKVGCKIYNDGNDDCPFFFTSTKQYGPYPGNQYCQYSFHEADVFGGPNSCVVGVLVDNSQANWLSKQFQKHPIIMGSIVGVASLTALTTATIAAARFFKRKANTNNAALESAPLNGDTPISETSETSRYGSTN